MTFSQAIAAYWKNYAVFNGRARRSAYWFAVLFTTLISMAIGIAFPAHLVNTDIVGANGYVSQSSAVSNLWSLATFLPSLSVGVRRLHDTGRSGWYLLWALLPIVGWILLIVALAKDSDQGSNKYGEPVNLGFKGNGGNTTGGTQDF